jgi:ribonucleoside-diphosphate reductase alpha chain
MHDEQEVRAATLKYFDGDELATNVWMTKYCLKDQEDNFMELTPDDMHRRLAREFARVEDKFSNPLGEDEIYNLLKGFEAIVPQGSPMYGIGNDYVNVSLSNCVVVDSPADNVSSIIDSGKELANLFKRRCGVGLDISNLRPENTPVNNAARTTTGAWSFADFYSYVCRMIGQNGRRGALMISMDVRHPDIDKFVMMKHDLTKVTGANVSVKISDDFMRAVENKETFTLQFPVDSDEPIETREIEANELWTQIVESATKTAEPGLLMWDNITSRLPANEYDGFKTICVNPCAEIALSAYDSCRLISVNLKNFVKDPFTKKASFDLKEFSNVIRSATRLSDDLVELENEKLLQIKESCDTADEKALWTRMIEACMNGRRTGLGTHGLADAIARLNVPYDGDVAIAMVDDIYRIMKISAYEESVKLAQERGAFPVFDWEVEKDNSFIKDLPQVLQAKIRAHGRRNISILTNAPTGSVSLLSQTSTGIEPVFRNSYIRRRKLSHNEQHIKADFVDDLGDRWMEYKVFHHNVQQFLDTLGKKKIPDFFTTSDQIDWAKRVEIQAAIQQHVDHSISSTINLPKGTSPSLVGELYLAGWKKGLKGITVYVDGSRTGVLVTNDAPQEHAEEFPQSSAPKRPQELDCDIHHTTIKGENWVVLVGLLDGKPYEVLGGEASLIEIPKRYDKGGLAKHCFKTKNNRYDLSFGYNGDTIHIKDVVKVFDNPNNSAFTRMISLGLRHGAKVRFMVEQLQKDKDSDMFSFARCIARILKNYIEDGEEPSDRVCAECNAEALLYQDGCITCTSCGYAKCG